MNALTTLPNGDLVAAGSFTTAGGVPANRIARWDGTSWSAFGSGMNHNVNSLTTLPNGDFVAVGVFTTAGGVPANRIARWDGSSWSAIGSGLDDTAYEVTTRPSGELVVGGFFTRAGGFVSAWLARLTTTCPATAVATGSGCPGSGGSNAYVATSLPWIGATFRARGRSIPPLALVVVATGFTPISIPLGTLLPHSPAACNLLVTPDLFEVAVSTTGSLATQLAIPDSPSLVGLQVLQQLVLLEVDPNLVFGESTSSNALQLTLGAF